MSSNPFIKIGDDLDAEAWNGAILMFASLNPLITFTLPADLDGGVFSLGSVDGSGNLQYIKAGFLLTFLTLVNTQITSGTIQLAPGQTTGTATFRVYPNIEPLKIWKNISWVKGSTGTVQCDIHRVSDSSVIASNISNPQDLSSKPMGLEFIDFVFTLSGTNPALEDITLQLQGGL